MLINRLCTFRYLDDSNTSIFQHKVNEKQLRIHEHLKGSAQMTMCRDA